MELELKHIQSYQIGGDKSLKVQFADPNYKKHHDKNISVIGRLVGINVWDKSQSIFASIEADNGCRYGLSLDEIKPLLLPMSSIYKEMEDGTVPIVELAKITGWLTIQDWKVSHRIVDGFFTCGVRWFDEEDEKYYVFGWDEENGFGMHEKPSRDIHFVPNQLKLFTYLFENHFDVFGLIDKGLALDKTKIK